MLHAQMDRGTLKNAQLTYRGEIAQKNTRLVTAAFAAGLMESALEEQVNLVNAMALARERGIVIEERAAEAPGDFGTLVQSEVTTERKTYVAAGTLFGKQFLRLVRLGSYLLDAHIDGTLLVFTHMDRPGLIGFIGRTLGDEGVNIGQMNVGREEQGGEAIGVVNLDSAPRPRPSRPCRNTPTSSASASSSCPARARCRRGWAERGDRRVGIAHQSRPRLMAFARRRWPSSVGDAHPTFRCPGHSKKPPPCSLTSSFPTT